MIIIKVEKKEDIPYVYIGNKPKNEDLSKLLDWQKNLYSEINVDKAELTLSMKHCSQQNINQIEKELKNFWATISLVIFAVAITIIEIILVCRPHKKKKKK